MFYYFILSTIFITVVAFITFVVTKNNYSSYSSYFYDNSFIEGKLDENLSGYVVSGHGLAKKINYPTANLKLDKKTKLKSGLYLGKIALENNKKIKFNSVFRINRQQDHIFAYLDNYEGNLYNKRLFVHNIIYLEKKLIDFIQKYHNFLDDLHNRDNSLQLLYDD